MKITCQLCSKKFKQITNTHLKNAHGITTDDYVKQFGSNSLNTQAYREKISKRYSGKNNPMYGQNHTRETREKQSRIAKEKSHYYTKKEFTQEHINNIRKGVKNREYKYKTGELTRPRSYQRTEKIKNQIAIGVKKHAKDNKEKLSKRGKKAVQTAISNGNWRPPMQRLKENDHDGTKYIEWKKKVIDSLHESQEKRKEQLRENILDNINAANLSLLNEWLTDYNCWIFELQCNACDHIFTLTRQCFTDSKFKREWCYNCYPRDYKQSDAEAEIGEYIKLFDLDIIQNTRTIISPHEIDIYIPSLNIGIEYNGLYWHSEKVLADNGNTPKKDYYKKNYAETSNVHLITIFEDEWVHHKDIVLNRLKHILNQYDERIYARNTKIKPITAKQARIFCEQYHSQGYNQSSVKYGLFYNDSLVSVMSFAKANISKGHKAKNLWELQRFCSSMPIIGGASKLFKKFVEEYQPKEIISYADRRWSIGNLYQQLGFTFQHNTAPNYWYFRPEELTRIHRFALRKNANDDPSLTEYENRLRQGYHRIWDCGSSKWLWNNN